MREVETNPPPPNVRTLALRVQCDGAVPVRSCPYTSDTVPPAVGSFVRSPNR